MLDERNADVVRDREVTRLDLQRSDPCVFREAARHGDVCPLDHVVLRMSGYAERRATNDDIWLNEPAVLRPDDRSGRIFWISLRAAPAGPLGDCFDRGLRQRTVVNEVAIARIGKPRRHLPALALGLDGAGPRARLFVREKRHRRDLSRPVTTLAVL